MPYGQAIYYMMKTVVFYGTTSIIMVVINVLQGKKKNRFRYINLVLFNEIYKIVSCKIYKHPKILKAL